LGFPPWIDVGILKTIEIKVLLGSFILICEQRYR
jgi:hypothetical protein